MPKYYFKLDGESSLNYGVQLQSPLQFPVASKRYSSFEVPGRNGLLHVDTGTYDQCEVTGKCFILDKSAREKKDKAVMWLMRGTTRRLEVPEDDGAYRVCRVLNGFDTEIRSSVLGVFSVKFLCDPERWLLSGETPISVTSGQKITNEWMPSKPLIQITGNGSGELVVGGSVITITEMEDGLTVDCGTQNAYSSTENRNHTIKVSGDFPVLKTGETGVTYSGGITAVQITPRWWTL